MDRYSTYEELKGYEREGSDYRIRIREGGSGVVIIAPHGGFIEPGTSQVAEGVAGSEHTLYCFEGMKTCGNLDMHITSGRFDEPHGVAIVRNARTVLSIHGSREEHETLYIGGLDEALKERIREALQAAGFSVQHNPRPELQGRSPNNICNRGLTGAGVQIEISRGLRRKMFKSGSRKGAVGTTDVFRRFVAALREALGADGGLTRPGSSGG